MGWRSAAVVISLLLGALLAPGRSDAADPPAWVWGQVYDLASGRRHSGYRITPIKDRQQVVREVAEGPPRQGGYRLPLAPGSWLLRFSARGQVPVYRSLTIEAGTAARIQDVLLQAMAPGRQFTPLTGAILDSDDARVSLEVPPGAFVDSFPISLTTLDPQGLPYPLPVGWSPLLAVHLDTQGRTPRRPLQLRLSVGAAGTGMVVQYDADSVSWRPMRATPDGEGWLIAMQQPGTIVVMRPDGSSQDTIETQAGEPLLPAQGEVVVAAGPGDRAIELSVSTPTLFVTTNTGAEVRARAPPDSTLPAGAVVPLVVTQSYAMVDGRHRFAVPRRRDLTLYRDSAGLSGDLRIAPDLAIAPELLREGAIDVQLLAADADATTVVAGPEGGVIELGAGGRLQIPKGAFAAPLPLRMMALPNTTEKGLPGLDGFHVLADVVLDIGDAGVAEATPLSLALSLPRPVGYSREMTTLLLDLVDIDGASRYRLVGLAAADGDRLRVSGDERGLSWPGIRRSGHFLLVSTQRPIAFLSAALERADDGMAGPVLVQGDRLPLVGMVEPGGTVVMALATGDNHISALDRGSGALGEALFSPDLRDQIVEGKLVLSARGAVLIGSEPAAGADGVAVTIQAVLQFDRALSLESLTPESVQLFAGDKVIASRVDLAPDRRHLLLRPQSPLREKTAYRIELATGVCDRYGNPLAEASRQLAFTTIDNTPPPLPEPGQIRVGVLVDGTAPVSGGVGATEPATLVSVRNPGTAVIESVLSGEDGGFRLSIGAGLTDDMEMTLRDQAGNESIVALGRPQPPPGTGVMNENGGRIENKQGIAAWFPGGFLPEDTVVRIDTLPEGAIPHPFSDDLPGELVDAVKLDLSQLRIPEIRRLDLRVEGLPQFDVSDRIPLFRIERSLTLPDSLTPGSTLTLRLLGWDASNHRTELLADLPIVAPGAKQGNKPRTRTVKVSGSPSLSLELPVQAAPGQTIVLHAKADPPYIKLQFPVEKELTGNEQFLLFEVSKDGNHWFWNLVDKAMPKTLEDGTQVVETSSPPYRGIRRDVSPLIMVMFYQASVSYVQVLHNVVGSRSPRAVANALANLPSQAQPFGDLISVGVSLSTQLKALNPVQRDLYEFSVIPVPAGVPGTVQVSDRTTNDRLYQLAVEAMPPGSFASVVVLGEDDNPLQVTATTSQNNHSVPLDASLGLSFSHLVDTGSVNADNLFVKDAKGARVSAEIRFSQRDDVGADKEANKAFLAQVRPRARLKAGSRYYLVATTHIQRPGDGQKKGLKKDFVMPFTTAPPPRVVGRLKLPGARSFDVIADTALVAQTDIPAGINALVTADLRIPSKPKVLARVPYNSDKSGPLWAVKGVQGVDFEGRNGLPVRGDLALLTLGNGGVFSTLRVLDIDDPAKPKPLTNAIVSLPLDVVHDKARLLITPQIDPYSGSIEFVQVQEAYGANLNGIPQTTAIPATIDSDGGRWAYFVNQGIGVMTIDLARSIPPPPPNERGRRFGPSYLPKDKTGAVVVRDHPSLREQAQGFAFSAPAHLSFVTDQVEVRGLISDPSIEGIRVNGFTAELEFGAKGRAKAFKVDLPMREGANVIRADAYRAGGLPAGRGTMMLLRRFEENPLAGSDGVSIDLEPLQVVQGESVQVTARVSDTVLMDEILVNAQSASAKRCKPFEHQSRSSCGWEGVGRVTVPLDPGVNSVVATAIDVDEEFPEGLYFADLRVVEGLALAVKNDLFLFDSTGLLLMKTVPIGQATRVSVARGVMVDVDGDGRTGDEETEDGDDITVFDELKNLALVGGRDGYLTFVDITEPHKARVIGRLQAGGPVYRAAYLADQGIALVAAADSLLLVDLSRAANDTRLDEGLDEDGDGIDDRILEQVPLPGAQDIHMDRERDRVTVLQRGIGLSLLRMSSCQQDLGVDAGFIVTEPIIHFATLATEKANLYKGLMAGFTGRHCSGFDWSESALLAQGSSACIWQGDKPHCSTAYQPGLSDYDFEFIVADTRVGDAKRCAQAMEDGIHDLPGMKNADVSVFVVPRSVFKHAYRDVSPLLVDGKPQCGAGDDPVADMCLGRNGLMLKWLLEGHWVTDAAGAPLDGGLALQDTLKLLGSPVLAPEGKQVDPGSVRRETDGSLVPILKEGVAGTSSHIPLLETLEWTCLEAYSFNASGARIRIKGAGLGDKPVRSPWFLKKIQKAAKAGIRSVYARLLSDPVGQALLLKVTRNGYMGGHGCYTAHDTPDQVNDLNGFSYKPCESFSEYVVSQVILSVKRDLKLFTEAQALTAWEMYRRKSDVGAQIADEAQANAFILRVMDFIGELRDDRGLKDAYRKRVGDYSDGNERIANLARCEDSYLPRVLPGEQGKDVRIQLPVRLYNSGFRGLVGSELALFHDQDEVTRVRAELAPGESRFFAKKKRLDKDRNQAGGNTDDDAGPPVVGVQTGSGEPGPGPDPAPGPAPDPAPGQEQGQGPTEGQIRSQPDQDEDSGAYIFEVRPKPVGVHALVFVADPEDRLTEFDKANNVDGFYYYLLHRGGDPTPPVTPKERPESPLGLPAPPASEACLVDGKAPPSVGLDLLTMVNGQYAATIPPNGEAELTWVLRNRGNVDLSGVLVQDSLAGLQNLGGIAAGATVMKSDRVRVGKKPPRIIGISTARGRDPQDNGAGVASAAVTLSVGSPAQAPYVEILSPRKLQPPYTTSAKAVPVRGVIDSPLEVVELLIDGQPGELDLRQDGARKTYRFTSKQDVALPDKGSKRIVVVATDSADNQGRDQVTVRRKDPAALQVVKLVNGHATISAKPGETLHYSVEVINGLDQPLHGVTLSDPMISNPIAPFNLGAMERRKFAYDYTLPDETASGRLVNVATAYARVGAGEASWFDGSGGEGAGFGSGSKLEEWVGPAKGSAEVLVGELILEPTIVLMSHPPKDEDKAGQDSGGDGAGKDKNKKKREVKKQLRVTFNGRDVTAKSHGTEYQTLLDGGTFGWKDAALEVINGFYKKVSGEAEDGKDKDNKLVKVAKLEVNDKGELIAKGPGLNVIVAVYKDGEREYTTSPSLVIVGIAELSSIDIVPVSALGYAAQPIIGLTERLTQRIKGQGVANKADATKTRRSTDQTDATKDDDAKAKAAGSGIEPFMVLAPSGPLCLPLIDKAFQNGYATLGALKFKFLSGSSDVLIIDDVDILSTSKSLIKAVSTGVAAWFGASKAAPWVGKGVELLSQLSANVFLVEYDDPGKDAPITVVRKGIGNGRVIARHSGWAKVKGTVNLEAYGWGKADDEFTVIVGPKLLSVDVRRGPLQVPKGQREVAVPLEPVAKGVTELHLRVGTHTIRRTIVVGAPPAGLPIGVQDPFILPEVGYRVLRLPVMAGPAVEDTPVYPSFTKQGIAELAEDVVPVDQTRYDRVLTFLRIGYQLGEWEGHNIFDLPAGFGSFVKKTWPVISGTKFTGKKRFELLADEPYLGVWNISLAITLELTDSNKLKIAAFELGFAAPNLLPLYEPMKAPKGTDDKSVARLLGVTEQAAADELTLAAARAGMPNNARKALRDKSLEDSVSRLMRWAGVAVREMARMARYLSLSRQVEGISGGTVHLGSGACFPFAGRQKDHYSPVSGSGGAIVRVRPKQAPVPGKRGIPKCSIKGIDVDPVKPTRFAVTGFSPEGHRLTFRMQQKPAKGALTGLPVRTGLGAAVVTYIPAVGVFDGLDFFSYRVNDGEEDSDPCLIGIEAINRPPVAYGKSHPRSGAGEPVKSVMVGSDPDKDPLAITVTRNPVNGTIMLGTSFQQGKRTTLPFVYTPLPAAEMATEGGGDSVEFMVSDGEFEARATVQFMINQPPYCEDSDFGIIPKGSEKSLPLKIGDRDLPTQALTVEVIGAPTRGSFDAATRLYRSDPEAEPGTDGIRYRVFDGMDYSNECVVALGINRAPRAKAPAPIVVKKNSKGNTLVLEGEDEPGSSLQFDLPPVTQWGGALTGRQQIGPKRLALSYNPLRGFTGEDRFSFRVRDDVEASSPATVHIRVNKPPIAQEDRVEALQGREVIIDVLDNDVDLDGTVISVIHVESIPEGRTRIVPSEYQRMGGMLRTRVGFTPHPDVVGDVEFTYLAMDNDHAHDVGVVKVTVMTDNVNPVANNDGTSTFRGTPVRIDVLKNDLDPDGDGLSITAVSRPGHGDVKNLGDALVYTPETGFSGQDGFQYTLEDGHGGSARAQVGVYVRPVGRTPPPSQQPHSGTLGGMP